MKKEDFKISDPISNIEWMDARELSANDYNPNVVLTQEMRLLEFSILKQGWIQPILVTKTNVVIDGFHRFSLSKNSKALIEKYNYQIPVVKMDLTEPERMMLTIRINRAKGNHQAFKMHEIVHSLINVHKLTIPEIQKGIGASRKEVELLSTEGVFEALDIKNHEYSEAWTPKK